MGFSDKPQSVLMDTMQHLDNLEMCPCLASLFTTAVTLVILYLVYPKISQWFIRQFTTSYQLTGAFTGGCSIEDELYRKLLIWLSKNVSGFQTSRVTVKAVVSKTPDDEDATKTEADVDANSIANVDKDKAPQTPSKSQPGQGAGKEKEDDGSDSEEEFEGDFRQPPDHKWLCQLTTSPGYSSHYFKYKGQWMWLDRRLIVPKIHENGHYQEMLTFTTWRWNAQAIMDILEEATPKAKKVDEKKLVVYKAVGGYWSRLGGPKKKRPLDTIILNGNVMQMLLKDIKNFLELEDWYIDRGIPYRRGYLLYGPPGCGKSSVIKALAGEIGFDICVFSLSQQMTDDSMSELMNQAPSKSIILLEDIDAAFQSRETVNSKDSNAKEANNIAFEGASQSSLTFRGLLNALDGVGSAEDGLIVFMTTNYPERLDPALVRPGRVDLKTHIDYPNDAQLAAMFDRFYPEEKDEMKKEFVKALRALDSPVSMAMVQGLMLYYKDQPEEAVKGTKEYFQSQFCGVSSVDHRGLYC